MDIHPTKVLIVDDNESIRGVLTGLLRSEHYEVVGELSSGDNFVNTVNRLHPDIICLDHDMPGKNGLTLLEELRKVDTKTAVLLITSTQDPEFRRRAVEAGVAGFLKKPFSQTQVLKGLNQVDHERRMLLTAPARAQTQKKAGVSVMIADDSAIMRELLGLILKSIGIDIVAEARDGQEAIDLARQHTPQAMCLDLEMPNVSGLEALKIIKQDNPDIKVIIISGHADRDNVRRAIELGACGFIIKPFEAVQVLQTARKLLF